MVVSELIRWRTNSHIRKGRWQEALFLARGYCRLFPWDAQAWIGWFDLLKILNRRGEKDNAEFLSEAIDLARRGLARTGDPRLRYRLGLALTWLFDREHDESLALEAESHFRQLEQEWSALGAVGLTATMARRRLIPEARRYFSEAAHALSWRENFEDSWDLACEGAFFPPPRHDVIDFVSAGLQQLPSNGSLQTLLGVLLEVEGDPAANEILKEARVSLGAEFDEKRQAALQLLSPTQEGDGGP